MNRRRQLGISDARAKNTKYVLKRLWDYLYSFKWLLLIAIILTILSNLFALIGPYLSGKAIDAIGLGDDKRGVDFEVIFTMVILMICFYVASALFSYCLSILMMTISKKVVYKMRTDAFSKIQTLPISYFDKNQTGDIISKMSYDIDTINTSLSTDLINICTSLITVVGSLIMMIVISPILVLVFVITLPISFMITRYMVKRTRVLFRKRSATLGELNGYVEEMITSTKTIHAYNREKDILNKFDVKNQTATTAAYNAEYYGSVTGPSVNFVNNLSLSLICIFGAILNIYTGFSYGKISSFVQYSRKFSGPINEIANIFSELQSSLAAAERVFALIDAPSESPDHVDADDLEELEGNVEFKGVQFGYVKEKQIIHNLSFRANKGEVIAIVGPTGAGKTTIVNLLMRFYDIDGGKILVDGKNIQMIKRAKLRKSYAMVLQDTWLFEGTVYENLAYGNPSATLEDVIEACKAAKIHGFVSKLPNGYDTVLNEGGINISKGQKQLLTIARAMLLDSKMLILDEATSNVDTRTELLIQEAMKKLMANKTCFIIAHRLSTIQTADLILVVKDGDIIESGNHQELLNKQGFYSELYFSQFRGEQI